MIGRYGPDHLNTALIILSFLLGLVSGIIHIIYIVYLSYLILAFAVFRMLSRNIPRRRAENDRYLRFYSPVKQKVKAFFIRLKDRKNYRFFRCPSCRNILRVPKGKGKLQITCPKCGERFTKNS
jgi:uncharacterized C2H2 Zn-finger protein